jgi:hypothetical protein
VPFAAVVGMRCGEGVGEEFALIERVDEGDHEGHELGGCDVLFCYHQIDL